MLWKYVLHWLVKHPKGFVWNVTDEILLPVKWYKKEKLLVLLPLNLLESLEHS